MSSALAPSIPSNRAASSSIACRSVAVGARNVFVGATKSAK